MSYGDSVAFHYNFATRKLEHSFGSLSDFDNPPYLINCKDELNGVGFRSGTFETDSNSIVFVTSDALAHYIIMMYEVFNNETFLEELHKAESNHSKNENYIKAAKALGNFDFEKEVIRKLLRCAGNEVNFRRHIMKLIKLGLLAFDDYSIAFLK